jgi:hypothetical protein
VTTVRPSDRTGNVNILTDEKEPDPVPADAQAPPITCTTAGCPSAFFDGDTYASSRRAANEAGWRKDATGLVRCPACVAMRLPAPGLYVEPADIGAWMRDMEDPEGRTVKWVPPAESPFAPAPVADGPEPESGPIVITREELTQVWDEQHPAGPAPVAADPEPAGDPAQPGEDVSPQPPEAPEPAPDATQVLNPGEAMTALLPPVEAPTALLPAVQDEEEQA